MSTDIILFTEDNCSFSYAVGEIVTPNSSSIEIKSSVNPKESKNPSSNKSICSSSNIWIYLVLSSTFLLTITFPTIHSSLKKILPFKIYFKEGRAKVLIGVCKGKKNYDKRESIKERDVNREIAKQYKLR